MTTEARIRHLISSKLAGRTVDIVGFVDDLLDLTLEIGPLNCRCVAHGQLRFAASGEGSCDVSLDAGQAKLRMACARLGVLCNESNRPPISPYHGEGTLSKPPRLQTNGMASSQGAVNQWTVRFTNTPEVQEFTIVPIKIASPALATP